MFKVRGAYTEHERYGPQVDLHQVRLVRDEDRTDGFREADLVERSRFDSDAMFADLRTLVEAEVKDAPLRQLVLALLDRNADALKRLPAHPRTFYPFPGGWLEHTLSVELQALTRRHEDMSVFGKAEPRRYERMRDRENVLEVVEDDERFPQCGERSAEVRDVLLAIENE